MANIQSGKESVLTEH